MKLFQKPLTDYFPPQAPGSGLRSHSESPGAAFLREVVSICDSTVNCKRHFKRNKSGEFSKDSRDSYQLVITSAFALMMSHFETFQKNQFSAILGTMDFMNLADDISIANALEKAGCALRIERLLAGRGDPREPSHVIADALVGWHDPEKVNSYFKILIDKFDFYSSDISSEIALMWQLRHSIVHTGGVITREDSMKHKLLTRYRDCRLVFDEGFIEAASRRLHIIIQITLDALILKIRPSFRNDTGLDDVEDFLLGTYGYDSPRRSWFRTEASQYSE